MQRIARPGEGRSGGLRVLLVVKRGEHAFFVHGFAKSARENLRRNELAAVRTLAAELLGANELSLGAMLGNGTLKEVPCDDQ